jgi:hypothetical protein
VGFTLVPRHEVSGVTIGISQLGAFSRINRHASKPCVLGTLTTEHRHIRIQAIRHLHSLHTI